MFAGAPHVAFADSPMAALPGADALLVITEWQEFRSPDFAAIRAALREPLLFDGRNLYDPPAVRAAGLEYFAIGRGRAPAHERCAALCRLPRPRRRDAGAGRRAT